MNERDLYNVRPGWYLDDNQATHWWTGTEWNDSLAGWPKGSTRPPAPSRNGRWFFFALIPVGLIAAALGIHTGSTPATTAPSLPDASYSAPADTPATASGASASDSITLEVSGPADTVSVGEGDSHLSESSPLNLTVPAGGNNSFTISAITGPDGGTVVAKILVNGNVVAQGEASGANQFTVIDIANITGVWASY